MKKLDPRNLIKRVQKTSRTNKFVSIAVALSVAAVGYTLSVTQAAAVRASVQSGNWSSPSTWAGGVVPGPNDEANVSAGHTVTYDRATSRVAGVKVAKGGTLTFDPSKSTTLETNRNVIIEGGLVMKPQSAQVDQLIHFVDVNEEAFVGGGVTPLDTDVGMWVMGSGVLDIGGTPKTAWTRLAAGAAKGATTLTLQAVPNGWRVGDEVNVAPTEPPTVGNQSHTGFDVRKITAISGSQVTLDSGLSYAHPAVNNGKWTAEVMNMTRNVRIEGSGDGSSPSENNGRAHIFIHATQPQSIKYLAVRHMGPRQGTDAFTKGNRIYEAVLGRYSIHFHHGADGSRGSMVEGVVARDNGGHAFVPHASHGVTMQDSIAYNSWDDPFWWDFSRDGAPNDSDDTMWRRNVAALVKVDPSFRGARLSGFTLPWGENNTLVDSVSVGVRGNGDASGFHWPENSISSPWTFHNNIAHNNANMGIFTWHNGSTFHLIEDFTVYYNGAAGVSHGAYANRYTYRNGELYGNAVAGFRQHSVSGDDSVSPMLVENLKIDGAGITKYGVQVLRHNTQAPRKYAMVVRNNTIQNLGVDGKAFAWTYDGIASGIGDDGSNNHSFGNHREFMKLTNNSFDGAYDDMFYLNGFWEDTNNDGKVDWRDVNGDGLIDEANDRGELRGVLANSDIDVTLPSGEKFKIDSRWRGDAPGATAPGWSKVNAWNAYKLPLVAAGTPLVTAGANRSIYLPTTSLNLLGTAFVNGQEKPSATTLAWTKVSGPGTATFSTPGAYGTKVTFSQAGSYTLRLSATRNGLTGSDDIRVIVSPANPSSSRSETWSGTAWPSQWTRQDITPGLEVSVVDGRGKFSRAGNSLMYLNTHNGRDVDMKMRIRQGNNSTSLGFIARRHDATPNTYFGASTTNASSGGQMKLYKMVNGTMTTLVDKPSIVADGDYFIRFKVSDNANGTTNLQFKVWASGLNEPSAWDLELFQFYEPELVGVAGRFGISGVSSNTTRSMTVDDFNASVADTSQVDPIPDPPPTPDPEPEPQPDPTPTPPANKAGDLNGDGKVNVLDLSILLSNWNKTGTNGDINGDGKVNVLDLSVLLSKWGS